MNNENQLLTLMSVSMVITGVGMAIYYGQKSRLINILWSIFGHWSQSIKGLLSLSISRSEQSIFEEEFKYLIVTSSLFNEQPLESSRHVLQELNQAEQQSLFLRIASVSILSMMIGILIITEFNYVSPLLIPCLLPTWIITCYFIYRHHRHVQVRRIHASALDSMHKIISLSQESDTLIIRLLNNFHTSDQVEQQQTFGTVLSNHFESYIEFVQQLQPLIDTRNLSTLRVMYNVNQEIPSLLLEFDSHQYKIDDIDLIYSVICWKRREYLLYLLALDVMSNNRTHYGKNWRQAIHVNTSLVNQYIQFNRKLAYIAKNVDLYQKKQVLVLQNVPSSPKEGCLSASSPSDTRSITLMHRVSALEKHVEDIQAKLFLCKQDTKSLSSGRVSSLGLDRISKRFSFIDENMITLLSQWEESKNALNTMLEDQQSKLNKIALLPSPPSSPRDFRPSEEETIGLTRSFSGSLPSFSNNRLHRMQSLKTRREQKALAPIQTDTILTFPKQ